MSPSPESPPRRRADAYFAASYEVARRLADGRGAEAVAVLQKELERAKLEEDLVSRRFLLSQIALCHARMDNIEMAREVLEEIESTFPNDIETALMLSEGYLLLLRHNDRAAHHAARALQWLEEETESGLDTISRAHTLMARALMGGNDLLGAFGAWGASPLPDWRVGVEIIEAGYDAQRVREVLQNTLPRHREFERQTGDAAVAASDRIVRLIAWIDAGCPKNSQQEV